MLSALIRLAIRNVLKRKLKTVFMFLSLMVMITGFLLIVTVSETIAFEVSSSERAWVLGTGTEAGCPYWCDFVLVPEGPKTSFSESILFKAEIVEGVMWTEPFFGTIPHIDYFSGNWGIIKANGTACEPPTPVAPMIEGVEPELELRRIGHTLIMIDGRFLQKGEQGVAVIGEVYARLFDIQVNDTLLISNTMKSVHGLFSINTTAKLKVVGLFFTGTSYDAKVLTTLNESQEIYGCPGELTSIFIRTYHDTNMTKTLSELSAIPSVEVYFPTQWKHVFPVGGRQIFARPFAIFTTLTPLKRVNITHVQTFFIAIIVTGAFIASSTTSEVYERRREIGLLKSIGFKPSFIKSMILVEILVLGATAAVSGFILANSIALISQTSLFSALPPFALKTGINWLISVLALSCGVSLVSSYIPACLVSWIPPIEALRKV